MPYLDSGQRKTVTMKGSSCAVYKCVQIHNNNTVQHNSILWCIIHNEIINAYFTHEQVCFHCGILSDEANHLINLTKVAFLSHGDFIGTRWEQQLLHLDLASRRS